MKIKLLCALATAVLAFTATGPAAHGQIAVYGMFSASHYSGIGVGTGTAPNQSGGITPLGGTVGIADDAFHSGPVALGVDMRGIVENSANSTPYGNKLSGFLVGGRLAANAIVLPFRPYVQAEVGVIGTNNGTQPTRSTGFAYQVQGGGDFTIFPHLGVRLEYGVGQATMAGDNNHHTLQTAGVGLVLRL